MGGYNVSGAVLSPVLGMLASEYLAENAQFIGNRALPTVPVKIKAATYPKVRRESLLKGVNLDRAPGASYARVGWTYDTDNYSCVEKGFEQSVDESDAAFHSDYFDEQVVTTEIASFILALEYEKRVAAKIFDASTFTAHSLGTEWSDASSGVPITDINTGRKAIRDATGLIANTLIISFDVFTNLGVSAQIIDRIKYTVANFSKSGGRVTARLLAQLFGLDQVLVGDSSKDTVEEGQDSVLTDVWSTEYAMLCKCATSELENIKMPSIGRTFLWVEDSPDLLVVETYPEHATRSDIIRVRHVVDEKITLPEAGYLFDNVTA